MKLDKEKEIKTDGVCTLRSSEGERVCAVLLNRKAGTFIDKPSAYFIYLFIFLMLFRRWGGEVEQEN